MPRGPCVRCLLWPSSTLPPKDFTDHHFLLITPFPIFSGNPNFQSHVVTTIGPCADHTTTKNGIPALVWAIGRRASPFLDSVLSGKGVGGGLLLRAAPCGGDAPHAYGRGSCTFWGPPVLVQRLCWPTFWGCFWEIFGVHPTAS